MKKLVSICTLLSCMLFMGCSDDDGPAPGLKVLSTTAKFDASGGEGRIEVQSPVAITAVSEEEWCTVSVSGQTVNVTVTANGTIMGRTAMVAITAGDETLRVPVYQAGDAFICDLSNYSFPMGGGSRTFTLKTHRLHDVSVTGVPGWLKYEILDEGIVFTAEPADSDRFAQVTLSCGTSSLTVVFSQWSVEGNYSLTYLNINAEPKSGTAVITKNGNTYEVKTQGMPLNATIKANYLEETSQIVIPFGQILGQYVTPTITYLVKLCAVSSDLNMISWSTNIQYAATAEFDEATEKVRFKFKDNGTWAGYQVIGLYYGAFSPEDGSYTNQYFGEALYLEMTKE